MRNFKKMAITATCFMMAAFIGCSSTNDSSNAGSAEIKTVESGKLTWATSIPFDFYEFFENDSLKGFDVEIAVAIANKLGLKQQYDSMDFDSIIPSVANGKADIGLSALNITESRKELVNFSIPYLDLRPVLLVLTDSPIKSVDDVKDKKVGVQDESANDDFVKTKLSDAEVISFDKETKAIEDLKQKNIDAIVFDRENAIKYSNENDDITMIDEALGEYYCAIAVSKGNSKLLESINSILMEMAESGKLDSLKAKYLFEK
ncbi:amino acid ABC transporter substrate-binding protein [bacterium]|nr:amino acid ABC transporter substrate-binding protein [bacterium]